jgi:hypothetical protein
MTVQASISLTVNMADDQVVTHKLVRYPEESRLRQHPSPVAWGRVDLHGLQVWLAADTPAAFRALAAACTAIADELATAEADDDE